MEKAKITSFQLFSLIVLFELGSAVVIAIGIDAKQDAWIAILLGLISGLFMYVIYVYLYHQFPKLPLTEYVQKILGKYLGMFVAFLYIVYFLYVGTRVLRDFGDLLLTSTLTETPLFVINLLMIIAVVYVLYLGVEVMARTGEFYLMILLLFGLFTFSLILFSGIIDLNNLLPVLGDGWKPVLLATFPVVFNFPFGEMIVFTMLLPYLNNQNDALRVGITAMVISGLIIVITSVTNLAVLGIGLVERSTFPLLTTVSKIRVADFLERLDALVVLTLVVGMFFKVALFTYVGSLGMTNLFRFDNHQKIIVPIGSIVLVCSVSIAGNFSEHLYEGLKIVPYYLHLPFQVYIPLVLAIIVVVRKKIGSK